jgi:hypothetical protein
MNRDFVRQGGDQAQDLLADYRSKVRDGYVVRLRFATNAVIPEKSRLWSVAATQQEVYDSAGERVVVELMGRTEVADAVKRVSAVETGLLERADFSVQSGQLIEIQSPFHAIIARISGNALRNLYNQFGLKLFAMNVRLPMTVQRATNKAIRDTAEKSPEEFFFYNNGVSAVCSEFTVAENRISASRFQIINGAQTVGALARAEPNEDLFLIFRLTATEETSSGQFTENIIRYNNTQNSIRISDFKSNDPIQQFLQSNLSGYSGKGPIPSFYYQAKQGFSPKGRGGRALTSDEFARIRHSFLYGPVIPYREPKSFWDSGEEGRYPEAFGIDGHLYDAWSPEDIALSLVAFTMTEDVAKKLKKLPESDRPEEAKYLFRLARSVAALAAVGLKKSYGRTFHSYEELLSSRPKCEEVINPLITIARRLIRSEWNSRKGSGEVQREYNLARDEAAWKRLEEQMLDEMKSEFASI